MPIFDIFKVLDEGEELVATVTQAKDSVSIEYVNKGWEGAFEPIQLDGKFHRPSEGEAYIDALLMWLSDSSRLSFTER
jgi:hypothetical protein